MEQTKIRVGNIVLRDEALDYRKKSPVLRFVKRSFDILAALGTLICLSWFLLLIAFLIYIEDGGNPFFAQDRAGKDGKRFRFYKFRSMCVNAEELFAKMQEQNEQTGNAFKIKDDPRITKIGKFIRKYSIDELPQLVNVLKGDMSIVGPRPILFHQMEECGEHDRQRLAVRPGLTCIWQISGRANIKWEQWVELDLKYIREMSIWNDIKIILKTIPVVLSGDGAY